MAKNLYLPPDASPERRAAQAAYIAASDKCAAYPSDGNLEAYRAAEREFGRILLAEDRARRPHIYAKKPLEAHENPVTSPAPETLKPCPFCGGDESTDSAVQEPAIVVRMVSAPIGVHAHEVECICGAKGARALNWADAVASWNRRT